MTKATKGLPLTIALHIPTYWTPEQAFAVFELIDKLRDTIWQCYGLQIQDEYRDQLQPSPVDRTDNPPFSASSRASQQNPEDRPPAPSLTERIPPSSRASS
jgi:hypothetical protein